MTGKPRVPNVMTCEERAALIARVRERAWRQPGLSKEKRIEGLWHADRLEKLNRIRARAGKK